MKIYRCSKCQSQNIEIKEWVNPNTKEISFEFDTDREECWCKNCNEITQLEIL
jgi:hypothetical protein